MSDQDEAARRMAFFQQLAREAAAAGAQDECDNPGCACHRDAGDPAQPDRRLRGKTRRGRRAARVPACLR